MRKKIIPWLTVAFILSLFFSFSLNASANAIDKTDTNTDVTTIEQVTTLSDNEYSTLDEFTAAFAQAIYNRQERTVLRLRGAELSNADIAKITYEILKHDPDNPKGGDYITYHMPGGYNYNFVVKEDENGVYTELVFECAYSADAQMEKEVDEAVEALLAELNLWEASDYRKIRGVYDWMADNITYDYDWDDGVLDDEHEHSVHAAIIDRVAVCDGISNLFYRLMLELDVDCRIITGGEADERHAWNIVKLNGVYYNVDATWDLGVSDYHRYFLCTESNFIGHDKDSFFESEEWLAKYPMATLPYVEHVAASGSVNTNIRWVLDADTGTLTVSGRGAIPSYRYSYAPWYSYRNNIARIVIEEGITEVGERSFYWSVNCSEVILPSSLIAIRQYGFNNLQSLEGITLPENLKIIEFCAFSECTALKSIVLPDSVTTVGSSAFSNCKVLTSAVLSAGMKEVPDSMFFGDVKLESIVLPEGITRINDTVFSNCAFTEFTIPSTVTSIGVSTFSSCSKLAGIIVDEKNTIYKSVDGVLFSKDGTHLICYPAAKKGVEYAIPDGTLVVDYGAFRGQSKLFTVSFPSTLVEIEGYAFSYCTYLDSLVFPKNLTTIGSDAFRSCRYLSLVTFKNPDVNLVGYTFADCTSLRKIDLPANLKAIPNGLFFGCRALENIDIPKTVTSIGSSAFFDCDSLIDVVIPGNVKTIGQQAFDFCKFLDSITFEEGVTTLDWIAIRNAPSLSTIVFPSSLKSIGRENFENCPYVRIYADCGSVGYNYAINNGIRYTASHNYVPIAKYPSTCTKQGYTLYSCPCGQSGSYKDDYLPLLPHTYKAKVTSPTCTNQGYTTHACSVCGTSYTDTHTDALGHSFGAWYDVISPDCTTKGSEQRDCSRCNYFEIKSVDPLGHNYLNANCTICGAEHPNLANYEGKVISILGDSSSTFAGYIPEADGFNLAHRARYPQSNLLTDVDETWWMQLITALDAKLGVNESWAGSQVLNTSDVNSGDLGPDAAMASLTRIQNLGSNGTPDIILFYGAGNDIGRAVTLGEFNPDSAPKTLNLYATKWNTFADAYVEAILRLKHFYPNSYIVVILYQYIPGYFTNEELDTYNSIIKSICDHYNIPTIDLRNSGITPSMLPDNVHPNADGMDLITQTVLDELITNFTIEFGENVVYSITHELNNATASKHYYKNVSALSEFSETITGENVIITMGGIDITSSCYSNGTIVIPKVTGDIIIKAKSAFNADGHLQQLSDSICSNTNLWTTLEPENIYYTANGWGLFSNSPNVHSVTFSVAFGDKIWATSFGAAGANGDTINGTRITWFDENGVTKSISRDKVYAEFSKQGYITVPKGAIAINIPMIDNNESFEIYILNRDHNYKNGICAGCGEKEPHIHFYKFTVTHPTCTEQGYTTYICECGDSYVDNYVNVLNHSFGEWYEVIAPTCTADGLERRNCIRCDAFETNVISKLGHSYGSVTTAPTCTEQGYTTNTCHCGDSYVDNYVNALGHTHSEVVVESSIDATCIAAGSYDNVIYCTECKVELSRERITVNPLGHSYGDWYEVTAPTCTDEGLERRDCARCDASETNVVSKLGHSYSYVITPPNCIEKGYTTYTCHCGDSYVDNYIDALGHTLGEVVVENVVEPTCVASGSCENVIYCIKCGAELSRLKMPLNPIGHIHSEIVVENNILPTCAMAGSYDNVIYCTECSEELSRDKISVNPLGHNYGDWYEVTLPTCTDEGLERRVCARCDSLETNVVSALGHTYAPSITAPTCIDAGYTTYTCHCGDSYVDTYVDALGHTLGEAHAENIIEPTCTTPGYYDNVVYCVECREELSREKITVDALGHTPGEAVAENIVAPTCTAEGSYDNVVYCKVCGVELDREVVVVEAVGHNYKDWVQIVAPGCETEGVERRECINCKKYETQDIAALGHEWTEEDHYKVCEFCGEIVEFEIDHFECEAGLFETIINAIINFFRILFGLPEVCVCGEELH